MKKIKTVALSERNIIFAPGPTMTPDWVWKAMQSCTLHHRMESYRNLVRDLNARMSAFFGVKNGVILFLSGSGSDMMERSLSGFAKPATHVLLINSGYFADRWYMMANKYSHHVRQLVCPWGSSFIPAEIKKECADHTPDLVLMQATDTSTGVYNNPRTASRAVRASTPDALFAVDAVLEGGISPIKMDRDGIDILIGSTQKAFTLPPGLGFVILGRHALKKLRTCNTSWILDVADEISFAKRTDSRYTPPISHMAGLRAVLQHIENLDEDAWHHQYVERAATERAFFSSLGFTNFAKSPSNGLSVFLMPQEKGAVEFCNRLERDHRIIIAPGLGKDTDRVIRIAHFSGIREKDWQQFHAIIKKILHP